MIPIVTTLVDWATLLEEAKRALGRSVSESLDSRNMPVDDLKAFVAMVGEFNKPGSEPRTVLRTDRLAARHLYFGFMAKVRPEISFKLSSLGLAVTRADMAEWAIISGRLSEWYHAIVIGLVETVEPDLKVLLCTALYWFERGDLGDIWANHEKVYTADRLYYLRAK